jgi:hypothetical protein
MNRDESLQQRRIFGWGSSELDKRFGSVEGLLVEGRSAVGAPSATDDPSPNLVMVETNIRRLLTALAQAYLGYVGPQRSAPLRPFGPPTLGPSERDQHLPDNHYFASETCSARNLVY